MALLGAGRPPLPGHTTRGRHTAPTIRWFVQWQELKIIWSKLTVKGSRNLLKYLQVTHNFFLSNKILKQWKGWIPEGTIGPIVLDILTLVHFVLFANLNGHFTYKYNKRFFFRLFWKNMTTPSTLLLNLNWLIDWSQWQSNWLIDSSQLDQIAKHIKSTSTQPFFQKSANG